MFRTSGLTGAVVSGCVVKLVSPLMYCVVAAWDCVRIGWVAH